MKLKPVLVQIAVGVAILWIYDHLMGASAGASSSNTNTGTWT